ncbi:MAG TPA: hypothetical protein PLS56_01565 [Candidatus Dojkabacteria bacterium]|nr:hypothetical protein [Candidatus Dojkabacteria bacterium]
MDYNTQLEQIKSQLSAEGLDNDTIEKLLSLAVEDSVDRALADIPEDVDDPEIDALSNMEITNEEQFSKLYDTIFTKAYGNQADQKKMEYIIQYMQESLDMTKQTKDLAKRYQEGDPTAVATVQANMDNPDTKRIQELMDQMQKK